ncbi:MAG TPA: transcription elongation factor GreA [Candidatus Acidoferrum sp.]|nr:transcription elongation factor GreA [Candidatus Acidoferrum sp.]
MKKKYQLTPKGKEELEAELIALKARRGEIAERIADARDLGDLSENAQYDTARDEQGQVESRISEIQKILLNASIIKPKNSKLIAIGHTVEIEAENGKKIEYTLVGSVEANPLEGRISDESPIGQALIGQEVGAKIVIKTPKGDNSYTIVAIK